MKKYGKKPVIDPALRFSPYVDEGPAYTSLLGFGLDVFRKILGFFSDYDGEYYGKVKIGDEEFHLADPRYIKKTLRKNGLNTKGIDIGGYVPGLGKFIDPQADKYGHDPLEIAIHEKLHEEDPGLSEQQVRKLSRELYKKYVIEHGNQ